MPCVVGDWNGYDAKMHDGRILKEDSRSQTYCGTWWCGRHCHGWPRLRQTDLAHLQAQESLPTLWKPTPIWQKKENGCATVRTQCVCVCIQKCIAIYIQDVSWSIELDRIWKVAFITVSVGRKIVEFFMAFPVSSAMSCSQFTASLIDTRYLHVCWQ